MAYKTRQQLDFGDQNALDASMSDCARGLVGSEILKIAADIRALVRSGASVCNLTVGDFDASQFPIPQSFLQGIQEALLAGETNYPPSDGVLALREAVTEYVEREWGVRYPLESVLVAGGARPVLYAAYRSVLNPGDKAVYPVPSWNNNHYSWLSGANGVAVETHAQDGFMPTRAQIQPHLADARLVCLNSPLNPTGTVIDADTLRAITEAIVQENEKRAQQGRRFVFLLYDAVYGSLVFRDAQHHFPTALVPESAPWVIYLDGVSKAFASTGLRVGWLLAAPAVTQRFKDIIGHMGAWAPRAEQVALAAFLRDADAVRVYKSEMATRVRQRLEAVYDGFMRMKSAGYPVDCVNPQGAIYLSLHMDVVGRSLAGETIASNEQLRQLLLDRAGFAIVPFQAFGLDEDTGWFRISVGAVSMDDIRAAFPRIRQVLDDLD